MDRNIEKEIEREVSDIEKKVNKLEHLLIGIDGNNGMRQDLKDLKHEVSNLKNQIHSIGKTLSMYAGGGLAIVAAFEVLSLFIK